jgi:hypothetical protein
MSKTKAEVMELAEFALALMETRDLDPLYVMLWDAGMAADEWLLAYWCFYHAGVASYCSELEGHAYWERMRSFAIMPKSPRGSERRHFRGKMAAESIRQLAINFYPRPDAVVEWLGLQGLGARQVMRRVTTLYGFGDWISWKMADMVERLDLLQVEFGVENLDDMFEASKEGAERAYERYSLQGDYLPAAYGYICHFTDEAGVLVPPREDRGVGVQEVETVLCKWKSHLNGHYHIGKDIVDIRGGLLDYAKCKTSQRLLRQAHLLEENLGDWRRP